MKQLTCLIVDDEPNAVQLLDDYVHKVPYLQLLQKCYDAFEALEFLKNRQVDLIFLDINMPQLTGMELAAILPKEQKIVFTTAYSEHALEGYEYNAIDYLLKPVTFKRFMQAVQKAQALSLPAPPTAVQESPEASYMFVKSGKQIVKVAYNDMLYLEAVKEYVCLYTPGNKLLVYKRMKELEESLPDNFSRIHLSYIINRDHITRIEDNHVLISNARIPISEKYRNEFLQQVNSRLL
ncbi:MAG: LytTR family DNA-binding domain-containing protein [Chitinophagaceae bacterium]